MKRIFLEFERSVAELEEKIGELRYAHDASAVDISEEKERYLLEAELPGFAEKDVDIKVNDRVLTIASSKEEEKKSERDGVWLIRERGVRTFRRSFSMPRDVDLDGIKAVFKDGLLSVTMPKRPEAREKTVQISRA